MVNDHIYLYEYLYISYICEYVFSAQRYNVDCTQGFMLCLWLSATHVLPTFPLDQVATVSHTHADVLFFSVAFIPTPQTFQDSFFLILFFLF